MATVMFKGLRIEATIPGDYYLIERAPQFGHSRATLSTSPGRTNRSGEARVVGWLGETNNVNEYGRGCVRVTFDADGRMRVRAVEESPDAIVATRERCLDVERADSAEREPRPHPAAPRES